MVRARTAHFYRPESTGSGFLSVRACHVVFCRTLLRCKRGMAFAFYREDRLQTCHPESILCTTRVEEEHAHDLSQRTRQRPERPVQRGCR